MIINIEKFKPENYDMIKSWWESSNELCPQLDMIPETSYVLNLNNNPILSVSLFLTNTPLAWIDNYIGNPEFKGPERKECGSILLKYLETTAKSYGKDRMFCMSINDKTTKRYLELGFTQTCSNITTFVKGIN